jgi:hypothetical protein
MEEKILMLIFFLLKTGYLYRKFLVRLCFDIVDIIYFLKQTKGINRAGPTHDGAPVRLIIRRPFKALIFKIFRHNKTGENFGGRGPKLRVILGEILSSVET